MHSTHITIHNTRVYSKLTARRCRSKQRAKTDKFLATVNTTL